MAARRRKRRKKNTPMKVSYKGELLTMREIAAREGCTPEAVRKWYIRHGRTLEGYCGGGGLRWGRRISFKDGEGMNLDTLFIRGRVDVDTYLRYLLEYERDMRTGRGRRAVGTLVDGRMSYRMTDRKDYFYEDGRNAPLPILDSSPEEIEELMGGLNDEHLPDFPNSVVREVEDCGEIWNPSTGYCRELRRQNWLAVGQVSPPMQGNPFEDALDDWLGSLEDGNQ